MATTTHAPPGDAYDVLAPAYATLTAGYDHASWLRAIEDIAHAHDLCGRRVLDVACGTGSSFLPLLERGYEIVACDLSPAMLAHARERVGSRVVALHEADMRSLPRFGTFDLILCLDDAMNHLLSPDEIASSLHGIAQNLAPGGILVFDVNTLSALRSGFSGAWMREDEHQKICWRGLGPADLPPEGQTAARVSVVSKDRAGHARATIIRERHHPIERLVEQIRTAGLAPAAAHGQRRGVRFMPTADELRDDKVLFFARRERV